jgi:hypothetical protein
VILPLAAGFDDEGLAQVVVVLVVLLVGAIATWANRRAKARPDAEEPDEAEVDESPPPVPVRHNVVLTRVRTPPALAPRRPARAPAEGAVDDARPRRPLSDYAEARKISAPAKTDAAPAPHLRAAAPAGKALLLLGQASPRDRARSAMAWSLVLGSPGFRRLPVSRRRTAPGPAPR